MYICTKTNVPYWLSLFLGFIQSMFKCTCMYTYSMYICIYVYIEEYVCKSLQGLNKKYMYRKSGYSVQTNYVKLLH